MSSARVVRVGVAARSGRQSAPPVRPRSTSNSETYRAVRETVKHEIRIDMRFLCARCEYLCCFSFINYDLLYIFCGNFVN